MGRNLVSSMFAHFFWAYGLRLLCPRVNISRSRIRNLIVRGAKASQVDCSGSEVTDARLVVRGQGNVIRVNHALVSKSLIQIEGNGNVVSLDRGVELRNGSIQIRGNNARVVIGTGTTFGGVRIVCVGEKSVVSIGNGCMFSDHVEIWSSDTHSIRDERGAWVNPHRPVGIGDRVWVGSRVAILKGVMIEDGAVIGMGSVVTRDVPAQCVVAGNPAKVVRERITWSQDYPERES